MKKIGIELFSVLSREKVQNRFDADTYLKYVDKKKDVAVDEWGLTYACIYFGHSKELMTKVYCNEKGIPNEEIEFYVYDRSNYIWQKIKYDVFIDKVFKALDKDRIEDKKKEIRKKAIMLEKQKEKYLQGVK